MPPLAYLQGRNQYAPSNGHTMAKDGHGVKVANRRSSKVQKKLFIFQSRASTSPGTLLDLGALGSNGWLELLSRTGYCLLLLLF